MDSVMTVRNTARKVAGGQSVTDHRRDCEWTPPRTFTRLLGNDRNVRVPGNEAARPAERSTAAGHGGWRNDNAPCGCEYEESRSFAVFS